LARGSWLLALGSWLLALGSWLLALGSWLLALGSWLLALDFNHGGSVARGGKYVKRFRRKNRTG
jgi:predicted tellurium resistance membrane protein TerC